MSAPIKQGYGASGFVSMVPMQHVAPLIGGCQFIAGDPIPELRAKRDPHCGKPRQEGSAYCPTHHRVCWYPREIARR